ncbi:cyclic nucleotide-binding domain-containing protein [Desulfosporosinus sp. Sb-LF]|uniref:cyclic nucleotide-binding domain-containing protein n=1 Tax=Desulfosporosinus sp. Sb-LF TaxID=2560027 RepID=UPI00107F5553|nr:cyclic nucleotide-binding domain-containing protein [Desulfosporosinus sp. Sb-LF]TGE30963.1 cyclic nucleotide-binding domain-containing protein [Desulfosporosinus sp. Sb-LF]
MEDSTAKTLGNIWMIIAKRANPVPSFDPTSADHEGSIEESGLWGPLKQKANFANFSPQRIETWEETCQQSSKKEEYYVLKNQEANTYIKLSSKDYFLWTLMDGSHTVKDLVVEFYKEYGTFAFNRVGNLVTQLKEAHFLRIKPVHLYSNLHQRMEHNSLGYWANRFWQGFKHLELSINGIDRFIAQTYRFGLFILGSKPMQWIYLLVSVYGIYAFWNIAVNAKYSFIQHANSYSLGILSIILINMLIVSIHEAAHAYTCHSYGRRVHRGGVLMFFGLPAAFVDTMDIWLAPKKARMIVSWAGPYSGLILCGAFSIYMWHFPYSSLNQLFFKAAYLSFMTFFLNLNPLLQLDGYFILMDWLEIPLLRSKSLQFIRSDLKNKIIRRVHFNREEIIMSFYGVLAAIWSCLAILMALYFWKVRFAQIILHLWSKGGLFSYLFISLMILGFGLPIVLSLIIKLTQMLRHLTRSLGLQRLLQKLPLLFGCMMSIIAVVLLISWNLENSLLLIIPIAGTIVTLLAYHQAMLIQRYYEKSIWQLVFQIWGIGLFTLFAAFVWQIILMIHPIWRGVLFYFQLAHVLNLLFCIAIFIGAILVLAQNFKSLTQTEKTLILAQSSVFIIALYTATSNLNASSAIDLVIVHLITFICWLSLICFSTNIIIFSRTGFEYTWVLFDTALILVLAATWSEFVFPWATSGLLLSTVFSLWFSLLLYSAALHKHAPLPTDETSSQLITDKEFLRIVFAQFYHSLFRRCADIWGHRKAKASEHKLNLFTIAANYEISFSDGQVFDQSQTELDIIELAEIYQVVLTKLINDITNLVGLHILEQTLVSVYDGLYWQKREVAESHLLAGMPWASSLTTDLLSKGKTTTHILKRVPMFVELDEDQIESVKYLLRTETFYPGNNIITRGEIGDKFYIIKIGKVDVIAPIDGLEQVVARLSAGDYFGEIALLKEIPRTATVQAKNLTEVYVLTKVDFHCLAAKFDNIESKFIRNIECNEIIKRMPIFSEFTAPQISSLVSKLSAEQFATGSVIIHQGTVGDKFYVIKSGKVDVLIWHAPSKQYKALATLTAGEYFGEIALLLNIPRTATVRALERCEMLVLKQQDFREFFRENMYLHQSLEQVSTRRLHDIRQVYSSQ